MGRARGLSAFLIVLVGCISPTPPSTDVPALPLLFGYICQDGPRPEPCPTTIETLATVEPAVALDPTDANVIAVAAGVATPTTSTGIRGCVLRVWTTNDAGRSWTSSSPVLPPMEGNAQLGTRCTSSPGLAFGREGALHVVAFDFATDPTGAQALSARNVYVRSADGGVTWTHATVLFDGNHPWITVAPDGTLIVTSRSRTASTTPVAPGDNWAKIALSHDDGVTWTRYEPPELVGCVLPSRPIVVGSEILFACAMYDGDGPRGRIHAVQVHPRTGTVEIRGSVPFEDVIDPTADANEYVRPYLAAFPDGRAVIHFNFYRGERTTAFLATGWDGGRDWSEPLDTTNLMAGEGHTLDMISGSGPAGSLHLWVLRAGPSSDLRHVVLDPATAILHEQTLAANLVRAPVPRADDLKGWSYAGAAFDWMGDVGALVWEHPDEGGLRVLRLAAT